MEAKASRNPGMFVARRTGLRERLAAFVPAKRENGNGNGGGELTHLVVGPAGVTVVDSRNYTSGRAKVGHGGLRVGRRNRSDLIQDVLHQVDSVESVLADTPYE